MPRFSVQITKTRRFLAASLVLLSTLSVSSPALANGLSEELIQGIRRGDADTVERLLLEHKDSPDLVAALTKADYTSVRAGHLFKHHSLLDITMEPHPHQLDHAKIFSLILQATSKYAGNRKTVLLANALSAACAKDVPFERMVELVENGAPLNFGALLEAVHSNDPRKVEFLVKKGAKVDENYYGETALLIATKRRLYPVVTKLLELGANPNISNGHGITPMSLAADSQDENMMQAFLGRTKRAVQTRPPQLVPSSHSHIKYEYEMIVAIKQGDLPNFERLLASESWTPAERQNFLFTAISNLSANDPTHQHLKIFEKLVEVYLQWKPFDSAESNLKNILLTTAVEGACSKSVPIHVLEYLLENGASPSEKTAAARNPPIFAAVEAGSVEKVRLLIKHGAKPDQKGFYGKTPLLFALERGLEDVAIELVHNSPQFDSTQNCNHILYAAATQELARVTELLFEKGVQLPNPNYVSSTNRKLVRWLQSIKDKLDPEKAQILGGTSTQNPALGCWTERPDTEMAELRHFAGNMDNIDAALDASPALWVSAKTSGRARNSVPFSNRFYAPENHVPALPHSSSSSTTTTTTLGDKISFKTADTSGHHAESMSDELASLEPIQIGTAGENSQFSAEYFSRHPQLPQPYERLSIVLAGRGKEAYLPLEEEGGRVVLLLSPAQRGLAQKLVGPNVDVCVVQSLQFGSQQLSEREIGFFTPRRAAAFELVRRLPQPRRYFSMIDDNVTGLQISPRVGLPALSWPEFYRRAQDSMQTHGVTSLGLKQANYHLPPNPSTWNLIDLGQEGDLSRFGQKLFFFDFQLVQDAAKKASPNGEERYDALFPPDPRMGQEDLHMQILLSAAGGRVKQLDRNSVQFDKSGSPSLATTVIQESPFKAEYWLNREHYAQETPLRKRTAEKLAQLVRADLARRNGQIEHIQEAAPETLLRKRSAPDMASVASSTGQLAVTVSSSTLSTAASTADVPAKAGRTEKSKSINPNDSRLSSPEAPLIFQFAALDPADAQNLAAQSYSTTSQHAAAQRSEPDSAWNKFSRALTQPFAEVPPLRDHQVDALRALQSCLKHWQSSQEPRIGFFEMATGTGKTRVFSEITRSAREHLRGNVALIIPRLEIKDQIIKELKRYGIPSSRIIPVSSDPGDLSAQIAVLNNKLGEGKYVLVFCEASFNKFVIKRDGNLSDFSIAIFDEFHTLNKDSQEAVKNLSGLKKGLILGFSATPGTQRNAFGNAVFTLNAEDAVAQGIIAPWESRSIHVSNLKHLSLLLPTILKNEEHPEEGNLASRSGVIYISGGIKDAEKIAETLKKSGINAAAYHCGLLSQRKTLLQQFKDGKIHALIAIKTLREGFDAPLDYVFIASEQNFSDEDIVQIRGRALRRGNNSKVGLFLSVQAKHEFDFAIKNLSLMPAVSVEFLAQGVNTYFLDHKTGKPSVITLMNENDPTSWEKNPVTE